MGEERRLHPRAALDGRATMFAGDRRAAVPMVDISESGCALRCPTPSQVGTFLRVNFRIQEGSDRWIDVDGVVRHMSPSTGGEFRYGIQFVAPSAACVAAVRSYVRNRLLANPTKAASASRPPTPAPTRKRSPTGEALAQASADPDPPTRRRPSSTTMRAATRRKAAAADQSDPEFRRLYRAALDDLDN